MTSSFTRLATVSCSTKRAVQSGKQRSEATTYLTGLKCTPLDPLDPQVRATMELKTPADTLETMIEGAPDIQPGDILVVGSKEYPIDSVAKYDGASSGKGAFVHLVIEDLKR